MSHEFLDYVEDMLDAMDKAEQALAGVDFDRFSQDFIINFAVAYLTQTGRNQIRFDLQNSCSMYKG